MRSQGRWRWPRESAHRPSRDHPSAGSSRRGRSGPRRRQGEGAAIPPTPPAPPERRRPRAAPCRVRSTPRRRRARNAGARDTPGRPVRARRESTAYPPDCRGRWGTRAWRPMPCGRPTQPARAGPAPAARYRGCSGKRDRRGRWRAIARSASAPRRDVPRESR